MDDIVQHVKTSLSGSTVMLESIYKSYWLMLGLSTLVAMLVSKRFLWSSQDLGGDERKEGKLGVKTGAVLYTAWQSHLMLLNQRQLRIQNHHEHE